MLPSYKKRNEEYTIWSDLQDILPQKSKAQIISVVYYFLPGVYMLSIYESVSLTAPCFLD